jgi:HSP20 family protein
MTSAIRWEPIEDIKAIRDMLSRALPRPTFLRARIPVDLYDDGESFIAELDAPGVDAAGISVSVSGSTLTVKGERGPADDQASGGGRMYVYRERASAKLSRKLKVPKGVDVDQISAKLRGGVLTIVMPKAAAAESMTIEVTPKETAE